MVYIDFRKAFDVVPHSKLIHKLKSLGICSSTANWIEAFLTNRCQSVYINNTYSFPVAVNSGVIQGSTLGTILFLFYINDLPQVCKNVIVKLFADDVKLYKVITSHADRVILQLSLDALCKWADFWDLSISIDKCVYMQIGYADELISYAVNSKTLKANANTTDLGVIIHSSLKPSLHCAQIAPKAHVRAKLILKCFLSCAVRLLTRAFTTHVRPLVEYYAPVWNPHHKCNIDLIASNANFHENYTTCV